MLDLPCDEGMGLVNEAIFQDGEERLYERWIIGRYEREMTFDTFKSKVGAHKKMDVTNSVPKKITAEEALLKAADILNNNTWSDKK